jgi:hypothetical protein
MERGPQTRAQTASRRTGQREGEKLVKHLTQGDQHPVGDRLGRLDDKV